MSSAPLPVEAAVARTLQPRLSDPLWVVAFSGGLDSTALLIAAVRFSRSRADSPPLLALHINHGLAPDADAWEEHCALICRELHIDCRVQRVAVEPDGGGLEAAARRARYAVFRETLGAGGSLLLGHHQDDQVETFFLRLMRGAGARGLAGMPAERALGNGCLLRPFLGLSRDRLRDYVAVANPGWIEDPSNADTRHDRNYLRHAVLPLLARRWPGYRATVTRAMAHIDELESSGQSLSPATRYNAFGDPGCDSELLCRLPAAQAATALRRWLREQGCAPPPQQPLLEFLRQLRCATAGSAPRLQRGDWCLQRHAGAVYLLPRPWPFVPPPPRPVEDGDSIDLPGVGRIVISAPPGAESGLTLRFRRGGERICLPGDGHHRALKTLLQSADVPPWWRERLPLLFAGDRLLAVADCWRARNARATITWERVADYRPD